MWKKWLTALMCAVLTAGVNCAHAQQYVVELPDGALIVNDAGESITQRGTFGMIYALEGLSDGTVRYAAEQADSGLYALIDEAGNPLSGHEYMIIEPCSGALMFMKNERLGVMDVQGNILIKPEYTYMISCGDGSYLALRTNPYDDAADMVYHISADGSERSTSNKVTLLGSFDSQGLVAAQSPENFLYGCLNAQGQWVIKPRFEWIAEFVGGQAIASAASGAGVIDINGKWLIEPKYDYITREGDSLLAAVSSKQIDLIDPQTLRIVKTISGSDAYAVGIGGGRAGVIQNDVLSVIDRSGETQFSVENCTSFSMWAGMKREIIVMIDEEGDHRACLFNMNGEKLAEGYRDIMPLVIGTDGTYYLAIDYQATQVEYDNGLSFWDEIPGTRRCSVIAADGSVLCSLNAGYVSWCGSGKLLIHHERGRSFADLSGNVLAEFEYLNQNNDLMWEEDPSEADAMSE